MYLCYLLLFLRDNTVAPAREIIAATAKYMIPLSPVFGLLGAAEDEEGVDGVEGVLDSEGVEVEGSDGTLAELSPM
jgi:hypothetical protein